MLYMFEPRSTRVRLNASCESRWKLLSVCEVRDRLCPLDVRSTSGQGQGAHVHVQDILEIWI